MDRQYLRKRAKSNHHTKKDAGPSRTVATMSVVRPVPLNQLHPGTVVWAHVPFADGSGEKSRPAVVRSTKGRNIELLPATTSPRRLDHPAYRPIEDLEAAGLTRKSSVRPEPVWVDRIELINITGHLGAGDAGRLGLATNDNGQEFDDAA